jgi:hypothetical protein
MFAPYPGVLIPLNSHTIERIEENIDEEPEVEEPTEEDLAFEPTDDKPTEREPEPPVELTEEKPKSAQEKQEEMLAYMKEMSSCTHENYEYYYSESMVGRSKKPVRRYFPVCAKCGVREKFVKAETLTDEEKSNAKEWVS